MTDQTAAAPALPPWRGLNRSIGTLDAGGMLMWGMVILGALIVFPPFYFLIKGSFTVQLAGFNTELGVRNYTRVLALGGVDLWTTSLGFAAGSSLLAVAIGGISAWLVARTNVPFRQSVFIGAFLSLSAPLIVKGIGWILLLGPNNGLVNNVLRSFGMEGTPIALFSFGGMIFIEAVLWAPIAFLLIYPPLSAMDPTLEEAAAMAGASGWQTIWRITLPLARPSVLAVLLLSFIRVLESFEVPLLIGIPARIQTVTTALYQSMHSGFVPRYGEASAYAVLLVLAVSLPLYAYYRATRVAGMFATVTGKGYRPSRIDLGVWKYPCALWVLLIPLSLAAPLLMMLWASFLPFYSNPSIADLGRLTLNNYSVVVTRNDTVSGIYNSLLVGSFSATAVVALALIMSWLVVRRRERMRWAIDAIASVPLVFPGIVLGIAILVQFLNMRFIPIYGTIWIVIFAFLVKFLPYGMRFGYAGILSIKAELEESARVSGAGEPTVLRRIVLPLALPAFLATWVYVFMNSIRDLSAAILLSGPNNAIVSIVILDLWNNGELPQLAALSMLVAGLGTALGVLFMRLSGRHAPA
jgi:iron(III) transport system permease protein